VSFAKIPGMTQAEIEAKLAAGQLDPNLVKTYADHHIDHTKTPAETCTKLSTLAFGSPLVPDTTYVEDSTYTYMMLFETGTSPAIGVRTMTFIKPTASSTNMAVDAPDGCSTDILHFAATLGQPIAAPAAGPWIVDWSEVTKDALGYDVKFPRLDKVEVAFYEGKTAADVQAGFLDIEISATSLYQVMVEAGGRSVDLAKATDVKDGTTPFPGFTRTDGVWLVAVLSTTSQTPAPVVLSIINPQ
jgi:hypothetical protein